MMKYLWQASLIAAMICSVQGYADQPTTTHKPLVVAQEESQDSAQENTSEGKDAEASNSTLQAKLQPLSALDGGDQGEEGTSETSEGTDKAKALVKKVDLFAACCTQEALDARKKDYNEELQRREIEKRKLEGENPGNEDKQAPTAPEKLS